VKSFEPTKDVEVMGGVVLAMVNVMGAFRAVALRILEKNGIKDPLPNRWYSHAAFLAAFNDIAEEVGTNTLYQIGRQIAMQGQVPPNVDGADQALRALDTAYHSQHRGGAIGHYTYISTGKNSGTLIATTPNHSDFDRGLLQALVERQEPNGLVDVRLDPRAETRKKGGSSCTYLITW
jgi:hypothetical protein